MKRIILLCLLVYSSTTFCQDSENYTTLQTNTEEVIIPGKWTQLNTMDDSGQTYLQNEESVIISVAQNKMKAYSFYEEGLNDYKLVKKFYEWDSNWRRDNNFKTAKLKENKKKKYIIWKFNDGQLDNVFLFGASKRNFINLLVYTDKWNENDKIRFLEELFDLNTK